MPCYVYSDSNALIDNVEIFDSVGCPQAILYPSKHASIDALKPLPAVLRDAGYLVLSDNPAAKERAGESGCLVVHGLNKKKPEAFLELLAQHGVVKGVPVKEAIDADKKKNRMLWLSSVVYTLGNLSDMASGVIRAKHDGLRKDNLAEFGVGAAFMMGDLNMMFFSEGQGLRKLQIFCRELTAAAEDKGVKFRNDLNMREESAVRRGLSARVGDFCIEHVIRIKSASELLGGVLKIRSGRGKDGADVNIGKMVAGGAIVAGWAPQLAMPNITPPDPSQPLEKHEGKTNELMNSVDRTADFFQADMRGRWTRPLAISNNIFSLFGAWKERKERLGAVNDLQAQLHLSPGDSGLMKRFAHARSRRLDYVPNIVTAGLFATAHLLFGASGKADNKENSESTQVERASVLAAANLMLEAPEGQRYLVAHQAAEIMRKMVLSNKSIDQLTAWMERKAGELSSNHFVVGETGAAHEAQAAVPVSQTTQMAWKQREELRNAQGTEAHCRA